MSTVNAAFSYDPALHWQTLHTKHFNIHFHDDEAALAQQVAVIAERAHERLQPFFAWTPAQPTELVLTDRMDFSNGSTTPAPNNEMVIIVTPPDDVDTLEDYGNWLDYLITHEYTHALHLDKVTGAPAGLRGIFGRFFPWLFPNLLQPGWPIEGLATFLETDFSQSTGRGQSSAYQMLMRLEVANGIKPLRQVNQPVVTWPAGTTRYLYGVYFMEFIEAKYGRERLRYWISEYSSNLVPLRLNGTALSVFHVDMDQLWSEFGVYLRERFQPQIKTIAAAGIREGTPLTHSGYYTQRPQAMPNGDVYYLQDDFASHLQLMRIAAGSDTPRSVARINSGRFDIHPRAGILVTQLDAVRNTNFYSDIYRIDLDTYAIQRLTVAQRYHSAIWNPTGDKILAVQNQLGNSALHLLDGSGTLLDVLWQGTEKEVIGEPHFSPDGTRIIAAVWSAGQWDLQLFDIATRTWSKLTGDAVIEAQASFTADGNSVVYSADYDGVYNIQRLEIATHTVTTLTQVRGGAFYPSLSADQSALYYSGVTAQGYDIFKIDIGASTGARRTLAQVQSSTVPASAPDASAAYPATDYSPWQSLKPKWWFPYWAVTKQRTELGVFTGGGDALARHEYSLRAALDIKNNWLLGDAAYVYDRWYPTLKLHASRLPLDYLDDQNAVARIRFSDAVAAEAVFPLLSMDSQWGLHTALVYEQEHDALILNSRYFLPTQTDAITGLGVTFNSAQHYPRSVSASDGRRVQLTYENSDVLNNDYSGSVTLLDWREYLALGGQHVLALRALAGRGSNFARPFRLGGAASEAAAPPLALATESLFNQRRFSLRGYPEGLLDLRGNRVTLAAAEWRLPIHRFESGFMSPPVGVHQLFASVFVNAGEAWFAGTTRESLRRGAGVELHTDTVLGYWLVFDLRLGYAHGIDAGGENQVYLGIGAAY
ncbi:MAG: hypothetical protein HY273_14470 [Gammaproteobacteria bacterium]|nr:hypothetical protein [Gammaproteobacteria bacterium]